MEKKVGEHLIERSARMTLPGTLVFGCGCASQLAPNPASRGFRHAMPVTATAVHQHADVVLVIGVVTILYTLFGGTEGIIWMDVIQGFILVVGGSMCMAVLRLTSEQGPVGMLRTAWGNGTMSLGPYDWDFTRLPTLWIRMEQTSRDRLAGTRL
jgi:hypothetical protein